MRVTKQQLYNSLFKTDDWTRNQED